MNYHTLLHCQLNIWWRRCASHRRLGSCYFICGLVNFYPGKSEIASLISRNICRLDYVGDILESAKTGHNMLTDDTPVNFQVYCPGKNW